MSKIEIGKLPPELAELLGKTLGLGGDSEELKPARMDQIRHLLEKQEPFQMGDIVTLKLENNNLRYPKFGEKVIITQVVNPPVRSNETHTTKAATPCDIAIAYVCEHGTVHEFLQDSREFKKVGSIYDPIYADNGEKLDVV